jgi:DNA-binding MarR family transcriptional regulator
MSKKTEFVKFVKALIDETNQEMNNEAREYWEAFQVSDDKTGGGFTENGKMILKFMQDNTDTEMWKAKDIADMIGLSSRSVSGSIRKLVTDGYVEKLGQNPTIYKITENGKNINVEGENE